MGYIMYIGSSVVSALLCQLLGRGFSSCLWLGLCQAAESSFTSLLYWLAVSWALYCCKSYVNFYLSGVTLALIGDTFILVCIVGLY